MRIRPGEDNIANRVLQRRLRRKGVRLGFRQSYREFGPVGLWLACLSGTDSIWEAIDMWRRITRRR